MIRTLDATFLNTVVNHPDVRPWLGGEGELNVSEAVENPANVTLTNSFGGFIGVRYEPGVYEVHSQFLPEGRGEPARRLMQDGLRYLFASTDCVEVLTKVPASNKAALGLARDAGFREWFARDNAWADGSAVSYQSLPLSRWMMRDERALSDGTWFHDQIEEVARMCGLPEHPQDEAHVRAAGAAVMMIKASNVDKGILQYNRWAALAGYPFIHALSTIPPIIDVGSGIIVEVRDGAMEVLKCPSA